MLPLSSPAAQDWPPNQHLLQRREVALVDGQCGRGPGRRRVPSRHVWHRGLVAHLGTEKKQKEQKLPASSRAEVFIQFVLFGELSLLPVFVLSV